MLCKMAPNFKSVNENHSATNQIKAIARAVTFLVNCYKVVLTFEFVNINPTVQM